MTLKNKRGTWSLTRLCTVAVAISTVVLAMPIGCDYASRALAPWFTVPAKVDRVEQHLVRIEKFLGIDATNRMTAANVITP